MMEEELFENKRKSRNLSEKKRRDQFNELLNDLSTLVCTNGRKVDKTSVLKSTIAFLKNHNETAVRSRMHDIQEEWKPAFISNEEFMHLILDALDSFIMVFSATGHIKFVSESVTSLLGHVASDIINKSIFDLAYDEDRPCLYNLLQNPGTSVNSMQVTVLAENQIKFQCHVRRGTLDIREEPAYELVQFIGYFRSNESPSYTETPTSSKYNGSLLFVCTGRLQLPQLIRDMSPFTSEHCEFTSRHSLEWKFLFLDHRAPSIIGYMPFEVLGTSGYDYYHLDDLEKVATCHEALMQKGELTSCYYRFLTKGQQWIWLQTRFYITYHQWNSKPEFVVCTHRVVRYADVMVKSEKDTKKTKAEQNETQEYSTNEDAKTEADVSMGNVSPSYMSESLEDYSTKLHKPPHSSIHTMSAASVGGNCSDASSVPLGTRPSILKSTKSAQSSTASASSDCEVSSRTQAARQRYGGSDSRSSLSTCSVIRRRSQHNPDRVPVSDNSVSGQYMELPPSPYEVSVPMLVSSVHMQFKKKQEELQQVIVRQQEELRRVTEQLVMARFGLLPPMLNMPYAENMILNGIAPPHFMYEVPPSHMDIASHPLAALHSLSSSTVTPRSLPHMSMSAAPLSASTLHMEALARSPQPDVQQTPQTEMPLGQFPHVSPLSPRSQTPHMPFIPQFQTSRHPFPLQIPQTLRVSQPQPSQISPRPQVTRLVQTVPLSQTLQELHSSPNPLLLQVPQTSPRLHISTQSPTSQMPQSSQLSPSSLSPRSPMSTQSLPAESKMTQQANVPPTAPNTIVNRVPEPMPNIPTVIKSTATRQKSATPDSTEPNRPCPTVVNVTYYY